MGGLGGNGSVQAEHRGGEVVSAAWLGDEEGLRGEARLHEDSDAQSSKTRLWPW